MTHSHPDHTSGFALLVVMLWLAGRRVPLPVHGPAEATDVVRRAFAQWDTSRWNGLPELRWHEIPLAIGAQIVTGADFELTAAPGKHSVPVIGVRARDVHGSGTIVYGADGEPWLGIRALAQGADLLGHEATGAYPSHSTAEGAAELASAAGVKRLVLVHLSPAVNDLEAQRLAASKIFGGEVFVGRDLDRYPF